MEQQAEYTVSTEDNELTFCETESYYLCLGKKINFFALKPKGQVWMSTSTKEEILQNIDNYKEDEKELQIEFLITNFNDFKSKVIELDQQFQPLLWC